MQENEILERIKSLCESRSWTFYKLAKESGITYSTLCTMFHKTTSPSLPTLIKICNGFGISLSEFFNTEDNSVLLCDKDKAFLELWSQLTRENQQNIEKYMLYLLSEQSDT